MVVASEFLGIASFASVIVAAEQGDHIPGELRNHQAAPFGECKLLLVTCTWIIFLPLLGDSLIPVTVLVNGIVCGYVE